MRQHGYDHASVFLRRAVFVRCAAVVALLSSTSVAACRKGDTAPPVATVTFTSNKARLTPGSPVEFTYQFDVAADAKIDGDYRVFVQVVDSDDHRSSWNDDHLPPVATSQWKPGQTIKYSRTSFVPVMPYVGDVSVRVGLYRGQERLPLRPQPAMATAPRDRSYTVGTLQLAPATEGGDLFIVRRSGWNNTEFEGSNVEWTWTQKAAVFGLEANPRRDVTLYLQLDTRPEAVAAKPQEVTVSLGPHTLDQFAVTNGDLVLRKIPVSAAQFGTAAVPDQFRIEVDRTFVPARVSSTSQDTRELGIRVLHYFVEAR